MGRPVPWRARRYTWRRASIMSSLAARRAGNQPKRTAIHRAECQSGVCPLRLPGILKEVVGTGGYPIPWPGDFDPFRKCQYDNWLEQGPPSKSDRARVAQWPADWGPAADQPPPRGPVRGTKCYPKTLGLNHACDNITWEKGGE